MFVSNSVDLFHVSFSLISCPGDCQGDGTEETTAAATEREERYTTGEDSALLLQADLRLTFPLLFAEALIL